MATAIRPVGYDDRLSVVEHLDELRNRLIASGAVFVGRFTVCLVFNHQLLSVINHPLKVTTEKRTKEGKGILGEIYVANQAIKVMQASNAEIFKAITAPGSGVTPEVRAAVQAQLDRQAQGSRRSTDPRAPSP